mgnify:CR=1 FL=1
MEDSLFSLESIVLPEVKKHYETQWKKKDKSPTIIVCPK